MFTSMDPMRRHKDPQPYLVTETGERVTEAAFGTPGVTIVFAPRGEYIRPSSNPVNEVLELIRDYYVAGNWGSSMVWLSSIAGWAEKILGEVPAHWRTDLPPAVSSSQLDELVSELEHGEAGRMLLHAGNVLERLADAQELAGLSYPITRGVEQ